MTAEQFRGLVCDHILSFLLLMQRVKPLVLVEMVVEPCTNSLPRHHCPLDKRNDGDCTMDLVGNQTDRRTLLVENGAIGDCSY